MNPRRLPQSDSIRELARFWDTHDLADFDEQLEEVEGTVFERRTVIPLALETAEAKAVRTIAEAKGIADSELIHEWVLEKIRPSARGQGRLSTT